MRFSLLQGLKMAESKLPAPLLGDSHASLLVEAPRPRHAQSCCLCQCPQAWEDAAPIIPCSSSRVSALIL